MAEAAAKKSRVPRWLKWTVGVLLGISATLLVSLTLLLIWIVNNPNDAWALFDKWFLPADLEVTWNDIEFTPHKHDWREWQISWSVDKLHITKSKPEVDIHVDKIQFDFGLYIWKGERWFEFRNAEVLGGEPMRIKTFPEKKKKDQPELSPFQMAQNYLSYLGSLDRMSTVEKLHVSVPLFKLESSEGVEPLLLSFEITKDMDTATELEPVIIHAGVKKGSLEATVAGDLREIFKSADDDQSGFRGRFNLKTDLADADIGIQLSLSDKEIQLNGEGTAQVKREKKPIRLSPGFMLLLKENEMTLRLQSRVLDIPGPLVKLERLNAEARVPLENDKMWSDSPATYRLWTMVDIFLIDKDMRAPMEKACRCKIPEQVEVSLGGKAWMRPVLAETQRRERAVDADFKVESITNKLFSADLGAGIRLDKDHADWVFEPRLNTELVVHSYQGLRTFLDAKGVLIPAPFDVLDGTMALHAKAPVERGGGRVKTKVNFEANLNSPNQTVQLATEAKLDLDQRLKGLDVYVSALIKSFQVELPPLDPIRGVPKVTRDSRVVLRPPPRKTKIGFKTRVFLEVKTEKPGAIRLLSSLAKPYVPVTIDVKAGTSGDPSGYVRLEPFTLSYLRRNVNVEHLQIGMAANDDDALPVDGRFRIDQTAYRIFVDVKGDLESPNVQLSSEPYLPRNEIISVLLYDRTSSELVSSDAETAGSVEAALADRAIGLFGLWAFATTPIKSFTYNPVTKVYSATVDLGGGLTAGVGTNWEAAAHLEVRKRVSKRWVLTASWSPSETQEQVGKLVLQWEKRF
jgi:hypothetical protein